MSTISYRFRLRRRTTGSAGAPADHLHGEMAVNETEDALYYGSGDDGTGQAQDSHKLFHSDGTRLWHDRIGAADGSTEFVGDGSGLTDLTNKIGKPGNFWSAGAPYYGLGDLGSVSTQGSHRLDVVLNGYRTNSGVWESFEINGRTGAAGIGLDPDGEFYVYTEADKVSGDPFALPVRLTVTAAGDVGIGEPTPSEKLDVAGDVQADGYKVGGTQVVTEQQPAIADSAGGDEQAKINAILAALRAHGLIAT